MGKRKKQVGVLVTRMSDTAGFSVFALDREDDNRRLATVFARPIEASGKSKKSGPRAEYALFLSDGAGVDPSATGSVEAPEAPWEADAQEEVVREIINGVDCELDFVEGDLEFLLEEPTSHDEDDDVDEVDDDEDGDDDSDD